MLDLFVYNNNQFKFKYLATEIINSFIKRAKNIIKNNDFETNLKLSDIQKEILKELYNCSKTSF